MLAPADTAGCECASSSSKPVQYDKWRRQVEILGFEGKSPTNQTFTRTIRNVTDDDDVYLHVLIGNPLRHSVSVKVTQEDTPDRPLLNISGSAAPSLSGLIDVAQKAENKVNAVAKEVPKEGRENVEKAKEQLEKAKEGLERMTTQLKSLTPQEMASRKGEEASAKRKVKDLEEALAAVNQEAKTLEGVALILGKVSKSSAALRGRLMEALVLGDEAAATKAIGAFAGSLPALMASIDEADRKLSTIEEQRRQGPKKRLDEVRSTLKALEAGVASASSAIVEGDMCLYLGRFAAGKTVHVAARLEERPGLSPLAADPQKDLRAAVERATAILSEALKGDAGGAGTKKADDSTGSDKGADKVAKVDPLTYSFEVMKPIHLSASLGFPVTWLAQTEYSLVAVPATASSGEDGKTPPEQVKLVPKKETLRVLPTFFVSLNVPPQFPSSTADPDPYEGCARTFLRRHGFSVQLGFPLSGIGRNYMFGVGFYLYPGAQLVGGVHLGKVTRLQQGWSENVPFDEPSASFEAKDATYERFEHSWYVGLTIDSTAISKILGGGAK